MTFPKEHRAKLHATNPIERLNGEIKRRTNVVGILPNDAAIVRLVGTLLLEQNDEWAVTLETLAPLSDDPMISLPIPWHADQAGPRPKLRLSSWPATPRRGTRSWSILVAAERTGRRCFAMELEPVYCDVAVRRCEMAIGRTAERTVT